MVKLPPRVVAGDTVAIVSPSWGALGRWPHRLKRGTAYLESLGLRVKVMPNAMKSERWVAGTPQERADDLNAAFADPGVGVILAAIGGNHSNQVAPLLDFDLIAEHPKPFVGYSDNTVLHWAIHQRTGLVTFYGPSPVLALAEHDDIELLYHVLHERTERAGIPVLANFDCGHTDPIATLPLGTEMQLDTGMGTFTTLAAPTTPST